MKRSFYEIRIELLLTIMRPTPVVGGLDWNRWLVLPEYAENPNHEGINVQNLYHLEEFFVVSDSIKKFLLDNAGCAFEVDKIRTRHPRGENVGQYWAMKVKQG